MFAISDKATGRSIGLMFLTDDMFRGVRCFKTIKLEYPRSWIDLEKIIGFSIQKNLEDYVDHLFLDVGI